MADIWKIKVGTSTYDIADTLARTNMVRLISDDYTAESQEYNADDKVYHWWFNIFNASDNMRLFVIYNAKLRRTSNLELWTDIRIANEYRHENNGVSTGDPHNITAPGKNPEVNGPTDYEYTSCINLAMSEYKWTFYMTAGLKFKMLQQRFNLYIFNDPSYRNDDSTFTTSLITAQNGWKLLS